MQQFSSLVALIYDAALDPGVWPATLNELAQTFGACFAGFGWEDTRVMAVGGSYANRQIEDTGSIPYRSRYKQTLVYSNPMRVPVLLTQEVEDVFTPGMLVPAEEYRASRYYREYVQPMGWGDGLSTILSKKDGVVHFLAFARKAGDQAFGEDDIALLRLLSPHIRRAYAIADLIGRQKAQVTAMTETFDQLSAAVFMINVGKKVIYRNKGAMSLLARSGPLAVVQGRLVAVHDKALFDGALDDCVCGREAEPSSIALSGHEGVTYVAHVLPFAARGRERTDVDHHAAASIFVSEANLEPRSPIKVIAKTFDLTPREMSILVALVDVGAPAEVAANLGVTVHTVKSHLKAIFAKTGVARQSDLIKLVASFVGPIGQEQGRGECAEV